MHLPCNLYRQRACKNKDQLFHKIESYNIVCATTGSPTLPPRICRLLANYDGRCVNHRLRYDRRPGRCRRGPALSLDAADLMHTPSGSSSLFLMLDSSLECNGCSKDCTVRISFSVLVIFVINGDADDIRLPEPLGLSVREGFTPPFRRGNKTSPSIFCKVDTCRIDPASLWGNIFFACLSGDWSLVSPVPRACCYTSIIYLHSS